jgi:hypothetical protein
MRIAGISASMHRIDHDAIKILVITHSREVATVREVFRNTIFPDVNTIGIRVWIGFRIVPARRCANRDSGVQLAKARPHGQRDWSQAPYVEFQGVRVSGMACYFHDQPLYLSDHQRWCLYLHVESVGHSLDPTLATQAVWGRTAGVRHRWSNLVCQTNRRIGKEHVHLRLANGRLVRAKGLEPIPRPSPKVLVCEGESIDGLDLPELQLVVARDVSDALVRLKAESYALVVLPGEMIVMDRSLVDRLVARNSRVILRTA